MTKNESGTSVVQDSREFPGTEARFHNFRLGGIDFISLSDGGMVRPAVDPLQAQNQQSGRAPDPDASQAAGVLPDAGSNSEMRSIPLSCLLMCMPQTGKWVLLDSGFGPDPIIPVPMPTIGRLLESLALAGLSPAQIDSVLISHLDPDHIGGLFNAGGKPIFPNATYYAGAEDVQFWSQPNLDLGFSPIAEWGKHDRLKASQRLFQFAGSRIRTGRAGDEVLPGIRSILLPGHTLGQVGYIIAGHGATMLYTGDALTSVEQSILLPDNFNPNDLVPELAVKTRYSVIEMLSQPGWYNFSPHFPWPNAGSIEQVGGKPSWKPVA